MEKVKNTLLIVLGNFVLAFAIAAFIIPTNLVMGGSTGISLMLHQLFHIRVSYAVMTVTHRRFLNQLEKTIIGIDPMAFMQITEIASVHGRGFTLERFSKDERGNASEK